ncbi:LOW QUALITY PROTEIN: Flo10p, partial [Saccharomyces cerevisiae]
MPVAARYIFLTGLFLLSVANVALGTTEACLPAGEKKNGMTINFYQYSLKDSSTYSNPSYMAYGYADAEKLGSVSGQTKLSIDYSIPCNGASDTCACSDDDATEYSASQVVPVKRGVKLCSDNTTLSSKTEKRENDDCDQGAAYWSSDLFGFYTTPTNVTVEMTGYFLPPKTGTYTFGFATVDDSAILSVGGNVAFECCKQEQPPITSTDFTINGIKPWNADAPTDIKGSTYMYAGYYYPIKIVYSNAVSWGTLPVSVVLPDGTEVNDDFEGYVFSFDDNATQAHCSVPNPAEHARTCVSSATSSWSSSEVCTECTETESTSYVTPYVTSSSWSSSEVCTECTETESTSTSTPYVTSSSSSSSEVCTECTETESTSYVTPYVSSSTAAANYTSSFSSSSEVCTECTETESTSTSTPYVTSSSWSSSEVCTECTETESTSYVTPYVSSSTAAANYTSSFSSSSEVCTECTETESTSTSTPYVTSSSSSSSEVCTECTETESTSYVTPYVSSSTAAANYTSSFSSSSEVCTECTETESTSTSTPYVTSSSWSSSEVCTECTETESTSYVTPYVSSSTAAANYTSSFSSSSEVCTECTETESTSTSTPYATSSTGTATSFTASTSNTMTSLVQTDTTVSFSLSSTVSEHTNAPTSSVESNASTFISSNKSVNYVTSSHSITPMYRNQTVTSSSVVSTPTSESSESSASVTILPSTITSEFKPSTMTKVVSISSSPTNLLYSYDTTSKDSTVSSTSSVSLISSISLPSSYSASSEQIFHSSIVSSNGQALTSFSSTKVSSSESESHRTSPTTSSESGIKSSGVEIESTSTSSFSFHETSTASTSVQIYQFVTPSSSPISTVAPRSTGLNSQTESTNSSKETMSSENSASVMPSSSATSPTGKVTSDQQTSSGFSRDRTTVYRMTSETPSTNEQTTLITVSSCESNSCSNTVSSAVVSTATTTINGITTYTTWCPLSATELTTVSKLESEEKTTLITTSCESGVCSNTASPAIVSTATATVNDVVTVYATWSPQATNKLAVSSDIDSASKASFVSEAAETKSISRNNNFVPTSGTTSIETHTTTTSNYASENSDNVSASEAVSSKSVTNPGLISVSQQPRGTQQSSMIGSSTASLEMSSYLGINHLLTNSCISIFIASLLAIV